MSFTNLATKLIQNGQQSFGAYPDNRPLSDGFIFQKFAFEVEMTLNGGEVQGLNSSGPLIAKTCELPRFSIDTQIVNVYNHKTIVQTKMSYEPTTITLYDQQSGAAEKLVWGFIKGQFDTSDGSKAATFNPMTVKITMKNLSGEPGAVDKVYTLSNVYIVDAQHDTLDYSTADPVLWTLTLRYEDLDTNEFSGATPITTSGIAALPKPPVVVLPPVPATAPTKADAKKEIASTASDKWVAAGGGVTGGGAAFGNPNLVKQAAAARAATAKAPVATTAWPTGKLPANAAEGKLTTDPESAGASKPVSPSTGAASTTTAPASGVNSDYKAAYDANYNKNIAKGFTPRQAGVMANANAKQVAPQYASQTRTTNGDGTATTRANLQPSSVNSNPAIANSQATQQQKYISASPKPQTY